MRFFESLLPALIMTALSVSGAVTNRATQGGSIPPALATQPAGAATGGIQDIRGPVEILTVTPWFHRVLLISGVLAVLGLIWWALRRRTRQQAEFRESAAARARARLAESWAWVEQPERCPGGAEHHPTAECCKHTDWPNHRGAWKAPTTQQKQRWQLQGCKRCYVHLIHG